MSLTRTNTIGLGVALGAALALLDAACDGGAARTADDPGTVRMALDVAPGTTIAAVSYQIDGPGAFQKHGTIDVSQSSTVSAVIGPLPPGMDFGIKLQASSADGGAMCVGTATFDVVSRQTTPVLVHVLCKRPTRNGSASIAGTLNVCPLIDSLGASPAEVVVGNPITFSGLAHDTDGGPSAVAYQWAANTGTFDAPTGTSPRFFCTTPGPAIVTLRVSDGDATPGCPDTQALSVTCTAP